MNKQFNTLEEAQSFIDKANTLLGYPNENNGTVTYSIPEPIMGKGENGEDIIIAYEVPITEELNEDMIKIATKQN